MATFAEIYVDRGTTFNNVIKMTDDITNALINVSGYTVRSQLRKSYYSSNISANVICSISDAANGEITMSIPAANTANLKPGKYVFDVEVTDSSNVVYRVLEGIITITPSATH